MIGLNLSDWALRHRSLVVYVMMVAVIAGGLAYFRLGRNEDPSFIIKTMVVQAAWPGATTEETMKQVTERLERQLQETPHLDFLRSFTRAGLVTIFVNLKGSANARQVSDTWYEVRKSIGDMRHTLPAGVVGPGFNDDFGDTFGIVYGFTSDGFTQRELRDYVELIRSRLLQVHDVSKIELLGAQDEVIFVEFSKQELATLGVDRAALLAALQSQNIVRPAGVIQTGKESISVRVSGGFQSEQDIASVNFVAAGRTIRLSDIAQVRRGYVDPPQPMFRVNGQPAIGLAIAMREGGDILALGRNVKKVMAEITADLPIGIEPILVADQAVVVGGAIGEFMTSLLQAIAIILVVSFISLGIRPGLIIALAIPLTLAIVFPIMEIARVDMQRISLGALIIALALLVDDAMTTTDATLNRLAQGDSKVDAATFAYRSHAFAMLAGTLVTIAGFIPVGFAASSAGEYTFSLFAVVAIALLVSWLVAVVFTPLLGVVILVPPVRKGAAEPGAMFRFYRSFLTLAMRAKWLTIAISLALFVASVLALPLIPQQFFPSSDRPELLVDLSLPQNASIHASEMAAKRLDAALAADPDVRHWSTNVGRGAIRFYLPLSVELPNDSFTQAVVVAKDVAARERLQVGLERRLAEEFPAAVSSVSPLGSVARDRKAEEDASCVLQCGRRRDRGREPEIAGVRARRGSHDAVRHVHRSDGPAAELFATGHGRQRGSARDDRRCGRAVAVRQADGLCHHSRRSRLARHDLQECGDPDQPDRCGARARQEPMGRGGGCQQLPFPSHHADGGVDRSRHDPDCANRILGADGGCNHGRPAGRDRADACLAADIVRDLVRREGTGHGLRATVVVSGCFRRGKSRRSTR